MSIINFDVSVVLMRKYWYWLLMKYWSVLKYWLLMKYWSVLKYWYCLLMSIEVLILVANEVLVRVSSSIFLLLV